MIAAGLGPTLLRMAGIHIDTSELAAVLRRNAEAFAVRLGPEEIGRVLEAGDGIAQVDGLPGVMAEELLQFPHEVFGMALNLERRHIGAVLFGDFSRIKQGDVVKRTCKVLQVPVGDELLGRVVTPLGNPIDGRGPVGADATRHVECDAPGIVEREPVGVPLQTGLKSIDAMTAIGRGQRELIIGDRQTGKTTVAIDTILNQRAGDVKCVYVAIGQKMSTVARVVELLEARGARENTIVVVASASDAAPLQYIAPFAACAMAEVFRDRGEDALIVYDDLSKHAVAYREISLVLERPPGREAYPGDIFYLHSRLLERAGRLHANRGGGSLTALPIVETQQGDYSAYIPTNLVSITDGQIYLESGLFHQGFRPAVNVGLSVSRVGGKAQLPAMKQVALPLRIDLAQYREVASFAELTSDLDRATMEQLHRGERLAEVLKQPPGAPLPVERQICIVWAAVKGRLDAVPLSDIARFESEWFEFLANAFPDIFRVLRETGRLAETTEKQLDASLDRFRSVFVATGELDDADRGQRVVPGRDDQDGSMAATVMESAK